MESSGESIGKMGLSWGKESTFVNFYFIRTSLFSMRNFGGYSFPLSGELRSVALSQGSQGSQCIEQLMY